jgi:hypothetical protein
MNHIQQFCRQVRARSVEHRRAVSALKELPGQMISILRQELDSMVRVIFLLAQHDRNYRNKLIKATVSGKRWTQKGSRKLVTEREMVDLANNLHGWTRSVYKFGCAFIHLSSMHDYQDRDPLQQISAEERDAIIAHLRHYHRGPAADAPAFRDIVPFLPSVYQKIAGNLECYLNDLERNRDLEKDTV